MDARKVLIVEDDKNISNLEKEILEAEGFAVDTAFDGQEGLDKAFAGNFDLVLLDVMLPTLDGFEICRQIRDKSEVPIIIVTAKEEEVDKVLGLELGADDYITKPFGKREFLARIKANTRRIAALPAQIGASPEKIRTFGNLEIDLDRYEVRKSGTPLELTLREFELLLYLAEREDKVISREQLLEEVWGYEYYGDIRTVDVTVRRLREKLEDDSSNPAFVLTKRGVGYYFKRP
jgi:two-component system response regulator VicR